MSIPSNATARLACFAGLLSGGCVHSEAAPIADIQIVRPEPTQVRVDFSRIYGGQSSASLYGQDPADEEAMQRVWFEDPLFDHTDSEEVAVEPWLRRLLFREFLDRGTLVLGSTRHAPAQPTLEATPQSQPTAEFTRIALVSGVDQINGLLTQRPDDGYYEVAFRQHRDQSSLCPIDWTLPIGYVRLDGTLLRAPDGALLGLLSESAILEGPSEQVLDIEVMDPDEVCQTISEALESDPRLERPYERFYRAATQLMHRALQPLY